MLARTDIVVSPMPGPCCCHGFTLVEVLVGVVILSFMGVAIGVSTRGLFQGRDRQEAIYDTYQMGRQSMNRMADELSMAFLAGANHLRDDGSEKTVFTGHESEVHFAYLGHTILVRNTSESDHGEVSYYIDDVKRNDKRHKDLVRRESPIIDDNSEKGGAVMTLAEDVNWIRFTYFDPRKDQEDGWENDWDTEKSDYTGRLPRLVHIEMEMEGPRGQPLLFATTTQIMLTTELGFN